MSAERRYMPTTDNKEDLLESGFEGLLAALRERQREARSRGNEPDEQPAWI
jgi:hypothetical protein